MVFLVAYDELACEELFIGFPVLQHLQVDSRPLRENKRGVLDGADFFSGGTPTTLSHSCIVSRMMIARLSLVQDIEKEVLPMDRPPAYLYAARMEGDPFPDTLLLEPMDADQHDAVLTASEEMKAVGRYNRLPDENNRRLDMLVDLNIDIFRVGFSSGSPTKLRALRIDLTPDAAPVKGRLRNYSQEQKEFLTNTVSALVRLGRV